MKNRLSKNGHVNAHFLYRQFTGFYKKLFTNKYGLAHIRNTDFNAWAKFLDKYEHAQVREVVLAWMSAGETYPPNYSDMLKLLGDKNTKIDYFVAPDEPFDKSENFGHIAELRKALK